MKIPVMLEPTDWGKVITALAMQIPLVADISSQISTYTRMAETANAEGQEQRVREHQEASPRGLSPQAGNSHRTE